MKQPQLATVLTNLKAQHTSVKNSLSLMECAEQETKFKGVMEGLESAISAVSAQAAKTILMTAANKEGFKLEDLLVELIGEIQSKSNNIKGNTDPTSLNYIETNKKIASLLGEAAILQTQAIAFAQENPIPPRKAYNCWEKIDERNRLRDAARAEEGKEEVHG